MSDLLDSVARYYAGTLAAHGPTPRGADWNSAESQERRFTELLRVCEDDRGASINDYGCGYGALAARLRRDGYTGEYCGYDVLPAMATAARDVNRALPRCRFVTDEAELPRADYTMASGIFNVKLETPAAAWADHVRATLDRIAQVSARGFAFNMLTGCADRDRMRPHLYYADPGEWLGHCLARFSRRVALRHDYPLYEFTVLVWTQVA